MTPELSKQLMEIALLRQGYGLVSRLLSFQPAPPLPHLHLAARSLDPKMITLVLSKGIDVDETGGEEWNGNSPLGVLASLCACEASGYSKCRGYHRKEELFAAGDNEAEVEEEYMGAAHNGTNGTYATSPLGSSFGRGGSGSFNSFYSGRSPIPGELTPSDALVACAELLISRGASIDHRNISGEPILFLALGSHNDLLAHMLLQKGAWYEIPGKMGNPFHIAAGCFSMEHTRDFVFEKLEAADESQRKAWLEMKDVNGYLPIHYAAQAGDASLVERMVGWDPELLDTPTVDGETALCIAAHYGHHGTVDGLLKLGADPSKKDSRGIGPIEAAGAMGHCRASLILHRVAPLAERDKDVPPVLMCQNLVGGCTVLLAQDSDRDCRRCGLKRYCSVECAKEDWAAGHRLRCPRTKGGRGRSASMVSFIG